jgi:hypothetical protein
MALSHCLECSEWIDTPCSYARCPFRIAAPGERGLDASQGGGETHPAAFARADRSFHSNRTATGEQHDHVA